MKHSKMKTLEATNKFELEPKLAEANGRGFFSDKTVYLTHELWKKTSQKVQVF